MGKLTFGQTGLSYQCNKVEVKVDGAPKCPRCQQRVYFNEEKKAAGKTWHSKCFTCENCKKSLDSTNFNQHNGDQILCTNCYRKMHGPQVYGFVAGAVLPTAADVAVKNGTARLEDIRRSSSSSDILEKNGPDACGRCSKRVYFAEEVRVGKKKWHKFCLRCGHCNKSIEPGKCNEHDGELFCQSCYGRFFGPRGYGYASGNGSILTSEVQPEVYFGTGDNARRYSCLEDCESYPEQWITNGNSNPSSRYYSHNGTQVWNEYHSLQSNKS